jgi:DNA-directed RNA polymerase beta subunit
MANADNLEQNSEINTKPRELELKMKQVKEEIGVKEVSDSDIQEYSLISTIPYLRQLVDEGKISVRIAYELYKKAKDKLQKIANLPKYEREQLLTTKEGRKIILEKLLGLVETAVNVKYIFQVLLSKLYEKTDNPTLSDIYELVLALRNEELDLDVNDEVFEKEVEALQQMPAQSFISLLSRLKPFVENRVLNAVTRHYMLTPLTNLWG